MCLPQHRDAYINDTSVSVGEANLTLALIFKEKYKALFLMPVTWDDARRFDYAYKGFQLPLNVVTSTFIRRLVYPTVETAVTAIMCRCNGCNGKTLVGSIIG